MREWSKLLICSPARLVAAIKAEAGDQNIVPILAGDRSRACCVIRWRAWRKLADANFSYKSIGRASGHDHTTVMHAVNRERAGSAPWPLPAKPKFIYGIGGRNGQRIPNPHAAGGQ